MSAVSHMLAFRLMCAAVVALAVLALSSLAQAATARRDVPWYMSNPVPRAATLAACRNDLTHARNPDCANAEMAETRLWAKRARDGAPAVPVIRVRVPGARRNLIDALNDPATYGNRMFRIATLANCRAGSRMVTARECAAALQADR